MVSGLTRTWCCSTRPPRSSTASPATGTRRCRRPTDRILATAVDARWRHLTGLGRLGGVVRRRAWTRWWTAFVNTYSYSLQQTLYAMGERVLETRPEIAEIRLALPNKHHYLVDLSPFELDQRQRGLHRRRPPVRADRGHRDPRRRAPGAARSGTCDRDRERRRRHRRRGRHRVRRRPRGGRRRRPDRRGRPGPRRAATTARCAGSTAPAAWSRPGLVNTHHHLYQWATRGPRPGRHLFGWLTTLYPIWGRLDAEIVGAAAGAGLGWLALSGCTTSMDHHYVFPRDGGDVLGRRDRGGAADRAAVPPDPRLDGPGPHGRRAAAGQRGRGDRRGAGRHRGGDRPLARPVAGVDAADRGRALLALLGHLAG